MEQEPETDNYGFHKITADGLTFSQALLSKILDPKVIEPIILRITRCGYFAATSECINHIIRKWLELKDSEQFPNYTIRECLEYLELSQEAITVLEPHISDVEKVYPTVRRYFYDVWNNLCNNSDEEAAGHDYFQCDDKYEIWSIRKYKYEKQENEYLEKYYWSSPHW